MGIGAYRHRVTFDDPAGPLDPPAWDCAIQSAATQVVDGQTAYFVRGRYHPGITLETQINFEGRTLQVQGVTDVDERHVELQLVCVEVVGRGKSLDRPPYITTQPESTLILSGTSATLTVLAGGTLPLAYQWMKNGVFVPGATGASYATGPLTTTASYSVRISNAEGFVTSTAATVTVVMPATITTHPQSTTTFGPSVTLTVVAAGTAPLAYQWTKDGVDIPGATSASYATGPLTATAVYAVMVANAYGAVLSNPATVTVLMSPLLTGLVSYWSFDSGWNDLVGTNHLTNVNGVTSAAGKIGNAGDFEETSSQYLTHPDPTPLGNEDFSYCFWFKYKVNPTTDRMVIGKDAATGRSYVIMVGGRVEFYLNGGAPSVATASSLGNTNWHFVVAWHDAAADTINLQLDGGAVASAPTAGAFPAVTSTDVRIGARTYTGFEWYFDGLIDEVGRWRRVLTPAERTELYNGGNGLAYPFA